MPLPAWPLRAPSSCLPPAAAVEAEAARDFMARMGASWTAAMDPGELTAQSFGVLAPPMSIFIDRDGIVRGRQIGQLTANDLERQLALTLEEQP